MHIDDEVRIVKRNAEEKCGAVLFAASVVLADHTGTDLVIKAADVPRLARMLRRKAKGPTIGDIADVVLPDPDRL